MRQVVAVRTIFGKEGLFRHDQSPEVLPDLGKGCIRRSRLCQRRFFTTRGRLGGRPGWTVSAKGRRTRLRFMSLHAVATSTDVSSRPRPNDSAGPIFLSSKPSHVSERAATSGDQVNHSAKTESRDSLRSSGTRRRIRHKRLNHISNAVNFTPQVKFFTKASC